MSISTPERRGQGPQAGTHLTQNDMGGLAGLDAITGAYGVAGSVHRLPVGNGDPNFPIFVAGLGDMSPIAPNVHEAVRGTSTRGDMDGAGGSLNPEKARRLCVAEALERYSSCIVDPEQLLWATATELGADAVDIDTLPQCSATELRGPHAINTRLGKEDPIRWVRAWSLTESRARWVPAVSVWMRLAPHTPGERFTSGISTGCATHTDLHQAIINGLCEVIERDSIALTWLQRIPWPRLVIDWSDPRLAPFHEKQRRSHVSTTFFDATSDVGVPTFYALEQTPYNASLSQLVMCNSSLDPIDSVAKMIRESASSRIALQTERALPPVIDEYTSVFHGAVHMGRPENVHAFDFLLNGTTTRRLEDVANLSTGNSAGDLDRIVASLAELGHEVLVVELTTDEARDVGFRVVRVIVPGLMPLSFVHAGRYLAHERLYKAPAALGYPVHDEAGLNHSPQPFA
jgi:ribosomal protein S12 methylthiotransferase accessory factor